MKILRCTVCGDFALHLPVVPGKDVHRRGGQTCGQIEQAVVMSKELLERVLTLLEDEWLEDTKIKAELEALLR